MIRLATQQDAAAILDMYNHAILNTTAVYKYEVESLQDRINWLAQKQRDGFPVFVYEENGEVVGFSTYGLFRVYPAYQYTIENSVYVHPNHSRKGIAKKLMQTLIDSAEREGYKTIIACIDESNEASIVMHEKFGFTKSGVIENAGYKFGHWLHLGMYQLQLTGPQQP